MTVLVGESVVFIDDDEEVRRANAQSLELAGFEVRVFADGGDCTVDTQSGFSGRCCHGRAAAPDKVGSRCCGSLWSSIPTCR